MLSAMQLAGISAALNDSVNHLKTVLKLPRQSECQRNTDRSQYQERGDKEPGPNG